ncbi:glycosyltransferase [Microbacterium aurantiacum]|uniref:glycosyltransferase n=1 Tax=Microbacterium aurantiacum TaxID=162393 RepID=UPI000C808FF6|nr:glycosyltransferase [Microbacterium aurantiacum]
MSTLLTAQRLVMPPPERTDALALYARGDADPLGRTTARIAAGKRASFATYFNAFPWGIWSENTSAVSPVLRLDVSGSATLTVHCVTTAGIRTVVNELRDAHGEIQLDLDGIPVDASWLWLEASAGGEDAVLNEVLWLVQSDRHREVRPVVAITTMNRVDDCLRLLRALGSDGLPGLLSRVFVVDQGTKRIAAATDVDALAAGVDVHVIEQDNLGGSGGFSRGMIEALRTDATHVLLLDDDVMLEPESIRRMCAFASVATGAPLVGAQMLSLIDPTVLHSMGEVIDRSTMWWNATEPEMTAADLAEHPIESTQAFLNQKPVDFNGWWMCLIPLQVVREIGAALPYFLKWDDAEYGLRASASGHRTITLPGAALWHVPWTAKDDGLDWQAYFQLRNRLVTALVHSTRPRRVLSDTWRNDVNHLIGMQYGAAEVRCMALRDILSGPAHLQNTLRTRRAELQSLLRSRGQAVRSFDDIDHSDGTELPSAPHGMARKISRMVSVLVHQLVPARPGYGPRIERDMGRWWLLGKLDGALMESAAGDGVFVLQRRRSTMLRLLVRSLALRARIWISWRSLSRSYRQAATELSQPLAWQRCFVENVASH